MTPPRPVPGASPAGLALAQDAWRLGLGALRAMPNLFGGTFLLLLAFELAFGFEHPQASAWPGTGDLLLGFANDAAMDVIMASALVAVHRSVLLGETVDRPVWRLPPTFDRYLLWLLLLDLPFLAVIGLDGLAGQRYPAPVVVALTLLAAGAVVVTVRLALLLPLSAMGAPGAGWRTAWDASRGRTLRLAGATLLTFVPMEAGAILVAGLFRGVDGLEGIVLGAFGTAIKALLWSAVGATLWARLLQVHGGALAQRPVWS